MEPLRDLYEAKLARDADACVYVAIGDFTPNARRYAANKTIALLHGAALAAMAAKIAGRRTPWWSR
jgi:hypothetical protein